MQRNWNASALWECKLENSLVVPFTKSDIELSCDPVVLLPGKDLEDPNAGTRTAVCTPVFTAVSRTAVRHWKQLQGWWRNELVNNGVGLFPTVSKHRIAHGWGLLWNKPDTAGKNSCLHLHNGPWVVTFTEINVKVTGLGQVSWQNWGFCGNWSLVYIVVMVTQHCECISWHWIVLL